MNIYIATRLERAEEHQRLHGWLLSRGHWLTYDWTVHGNVRGHGALARIRDIGDAETRGVLDAGAVIALLPGGRGTHWECGIAVGACKPLFLWGPASTGVLGEDERTCALYHARGQRITHCDAENWDEFLGALGEWLGRCALKEGRS